MYCVKLAGANLTGVNFTMANLFKADMRHATIFKTCFTKANINNIEYITK
jgi:uncharacterized protein YjbI with pentapeptide repeats